MQTNLSEYIEKWIEGIDSEIQFWSRWLKDKGRLWPYISGWYCNRKGKY